MLTKVDCKCGCCEPMERLRYFPRQMLTADDMRAEQEYFRDKLRRHNQYLHGWGVVCGCTVEPVTEAKGWRVRVCPGYAVSPQGDEIWIDDCVEVDLHTGAENPPCTVRWPCPPQGEMPPSRDGRTIVYIAARYAECFTRPVRVHPAGCGCDETGCEYSRVCDSFEIKVLWELPQSHIDAREDDEKWCALIQQQSALLHRRHMFPAPPCPECINDPWVVLATIAVPGQSTAGAPAGHLQISYNDVRVLLATQRLQIATVCIS